jgi:hypothetical protein
MPFFNRLQQNNNTTLLKFQRNSMPLLGVFFFVAVAIRYCYKNRNGLVMAVERHRFAEDNLGTVQNNLVVGEGDEGIHVINYPKGVLSQYMRERDYSYRD